MFLFSLAQKQPEILVPLQRTGETVIESHTNNVTDDSINVKEIVWNSFCDIDLSTYIFIQTWFFLFSSVHCYFHFFFTLVFEVDLIFSQDMREVKVNSLSVIVLARFVFFLALISSVFFFFCFHSIGFIYINFSSILRSERKVRLVYLFHLHWIGFSNIYQNLYES